ncbi:MAG: 2-oxoacid:acceptor oxidoreductase subunit alpha [Chloroflexi bacterium]|nr:MAG: 2-oxoacid:acceptor oxidoreductase subunit alpha [Chloroflexota bacterium]
MDLSQTILESESKQNSKMVVNDFTITVATVNGSGSQTSNITIMRSLLKMGIPVSGKNLFPSNIQGLPTWYTIRVNKDGYTARSETNHIVIAMNPESFVKDVEGIIPGGVLYYADNIKFPINRDDITVYAMPVQSLVRESEVPTNLRDYIANMVYVGILAQMIGIELDSIYQALQFHFKGKQKPIDMNYEMVKKAAKWAAENLAKSDPYQVKTMEAAKNCMMIDGNTAAALGALFGGVQFAAWYPITPASSLAEALLEYAPELRKDPETGKNTFAIIQAEDELAAIGMAVGAGWAGLRAMTSSSGPGISLMAEYIGLAYYSEVPVVIWDVQRVGPSTGLPTRTAQADLTFINFISHGDTEHVILLPGTIKECFEYGWKSFDIAERLQTPVFVLLDLDFGMNNWMTSPFDYPDGPMDRGKVLWEGDLNQLDNHFARYKDVDGDGITYRTVLGNRHPNAAYFTRGTGHDEYARYTEDHQVYEEMMNRLRLKFQTARKVVPPPVIEKMDGADFGIIAYGSTEPVIVETRDRFLDKGIKTDYMRLRALPFSKEVAEFIRSHDRTYVVEINRDGQMHQLLSLDVPDKAASLKSIAHLDGLPLTATWVESAILAEEEKLS